MREGETGTYMTNGDIVECAGKKRIQDVQRLTKNSKEAKWRRERRCHTNPDLVRGGCGINTVYNKGSFIFLPPIPHIYHEIYRVNWIFG